MQPARFALGVLFVLSCSAASEPVPATGSLPACPDPDLLACTGLYGPNGETWSTREIASDVLAYEPGLQFWSDGLLKTRYVRLPAGTRIDTSDPDAWIFPVGTAFWKEFRSDGRLIETRHMLKVSERAWYFMAYAWTADGSNAVAARQGQTHVPGTPGDSYEIPSDQACYTCHGGRPDKILGFEALALSLPNARGLPLTELVQRGLLTEPPTVLPIPGDPTAQAALGYLHVNCGIACHNPTDGALASWTGMHLRLESTALDTLEHTRTYATAVGVPSGFKPPGAGPFFRIAPGDIEHSAIAYRDGQRGNPAQMPPLATHTVDEAGLAQVKAWIQALGASR